MSHSDDVNIGPHGGAGEMAQRLRALAALPEDRVQFPATTRWLTKILKPLVGKRKAATLDFIQDKLGLLMCALERKHARSQAKMFRT